MSEHRLSLPAFQEALKRHPEALKAVPSTTGDRYRAGEFPRVVRWLLRHPELLRALADDAEKRCPIASKQA